MNFSDLIFRKAQDKDLNKIIQMLADDVLGKKRENLQDLEIYKKAFVEISNDKNNYLMVVEFANEIIATCHLVIMPSLTRMASKRINIEAVRVDKKFTNNGIGSWMIKKVIEFAQVNDVKIVQLTTDKTRIDAHRFYEKLGFKASHEGMKLYL